MINVLVFFDLEHIDKMWTKGKKWRVQSNISQVFWAFYLQLPMIL